jgi:ribosomal protein S18 acetylase RimI-like enzyme
VAQVRLDAMPARVDDRPMSLRIRDFRPEDAGAVNRIAVAAWDQYRSVFRDWPRSAPNFARTADFAGELDLLIAEDAAGIRGFVGYVAPGRPRERIFRRDWATIRMLSVDPPSRGRGIGRLLAEECIGRARRDGAAAVALHTSPVMQAALALYLRLGFSHFRDIMDRHGVHYAVYVLRLTAAAGPAPGRGLRGWLGRWLDKS